MGGNRIDRFSVEQLLSTGSGARQMTELEEIIRGEIKASGVISFARFMELALYHPAHGYYERHTRQTGREGDFMTSVSVGSLYGELLGSEFAHRFSRLDAAEPVLIEAGAHDGQLARDILAYLEEYQEEAFRRATYVIIEPSASRVRAQTQTLQPFDGKVRWVKSWSELGDFHGICFSNELLDAMPVHVLRWNASRNEWMEWGVTAREEGFEWSAVPTERQSANAKKLLARLPRELLEVLPDQFTIEISPEAVSWWLQAAHALQSGWLFTIDYGLLQDDFLTPQRAEGTLRAYSRHHLHDNILGAAGEQDITAHVNFSLVIAAGESAGLKTESLTQQGNFIKTLLEQVEESPSSFPLWTPMRYRQLMSLMHPEHLGRAFKVLVQGRT